MWTWLNVTGDQVKCLKNSENGKNDKNQSHPKGLESYIFALETMANISFLRYFQMAVSQIIHGLSPSLGLQTFYSPQNWCESLSFLHAILKKPQTTVLHIWIYLRKQHTHF